MTLRSLSKFAVPFQSAIFSREIIVVSHNKAGALKSAMNCEEYAPSRCFGIPKRIEVIRRFKKLK